MSVIMTDVLLVAVAVITIAEALAIDLAPLQWMAAGEVPLRLDG